MITTLRLKSLFVLTIIAFAIPLLLLTSAYFQVQDLAICALCFVVLF